MKNIYNKVIIDATILISTVAVWLTTEKTLGMVVLMASLKSLLFRKKLYLFLVGLQPVFDQRRQVVGMSRLMQPSCQHLTEFVKLVNHRRDDEPQHASYNSDSRSHGDEDGQRTYSDVGLFSINFTTG